MALLAIRVSIEWVSSSARVTSVKSTKVLPLTDRHLDTKIRPGTPGSDKNMEYVGSIEKKCLPSEFLLEWKPSSGMACNAVINVIY